MERSAIPFSTTTVGSKMGDQDIIISQSQPINVTIESGSDDIVVQISESQKIDATIIQEQPITVIFTNPISGTAGTSGTSGTGGGAGGGGMLWAIVFGG